MSDAQQSAHLPKPVPDGFVPGKNGGFLRAPWKSGDVAPGGHRSQAQFRHCQELCRTHSPKSARAIISLSETTEDERIAFMCNAWIYERAWGKPKEMDPRDFERAKMVLDVSKLSPEQIDLLLQITRSGALRPADDADQSPDDASDAGDAQTEPATIDGTATETK